MKVIFFVRTCYLIHIPEVELSDKAELTQGDELKKMLLMTQIANNCPRMYFSYKINSVNTSFKYICI